MATVSKKVPSLAERRQPPGLAEDFADLMRALKSFAGTYRPELHYMRGPGPAWHAKHNPAPAMVDARAVPALVRVKA